MFAYPLVRFARRALAWPCLPLVLLVSASLPGRCAQAAADKTAPATLSTAERQQVKNLVAEFRKARTKPAERDKIVSQILEIGGPANGQLLAVLNKELFGQSRAYGQKFQKRAVTLSRGKTDKIDVAELARLRAQVLALKSQENLTKEMIVQQGDPAMARLSEMLVLDRKVVLDKSPELRAERDKLLLLGHSWEQVSAAMTQPSTADKSITGKEKPAEGTDGSEKPASFEDYLQGEEKLSAQLAMPMDDGTRAILAANANLASKLDPEEARAILACNLTRNLLGLSTLTIDLQLSAAARDHSHDMETQNFFAHESPVPGKLQPWDRARNFGTTASSENIFMGRTDGNQANLAWFHSPGHHKNMLADHNRIGMGRSGAHFTELFGK
jgi:uncharacterized protein YkwD